MAMIVNTQEIHGSRVETRSGTRLGRVLGCDIDVTNGQIITVHVRPSVILRPFVTRELLISWKDVLEIREGIVIVHDGDVPEAHRSPLWRPVPTM